MIGRLFRLVRRSGNKKKRRLVANASPRFVDNTSLLLCWLSSRSMFVFRFFNSVHNFHSGAVLRRSRRESIERWEDSPCTREKDAFQGEHASPDYSPDERITSRPNKVKNTQINLDCMVEGSGNNSIQVSCVCIYTLFHAQGYQFSRCRE